MTKFTLITLSIITGLFFFSKSYAVDAKDWEEMVPFVLRGENYGLNELVFAAVLSTEKLIGEKPTEFYKKLYDISKNAILIPIPNQTHDITNVGLFARKANEKGGVSTFGIVFNFKPQSFALIDVLSRYGSESAEVITKDDFTKEIRYSIHFGGQLKANGNSVFGYSPLKKGETFLLIFTSQDKVFIDSLVITCGSSG